MPKIKVNKGGCEIGRKKEPLGGCKIGKKAPENKPMKATPKPAKTPQKATVIPPKPKKEPMKAKVIPAKPKPKFNVVKKKVTPAKKAEINLPKFLGHVGSEYATGADSWWFENENKKKWKKMYNDFIEESFRKQGIKETPNRKTGGSDFDYSMKQYDIAGDYADNKMRQYWHTKIEKK